MAQGSGHFVGRTAELQLLTEELSKAQSQRPRVVLLDGEAGVGKTSLVRQFLDQAPQVTVLRAVGDQTLHTDSYAVVSQLSPRLDRSSADDERAAIRDPLQVGAELLESISDRQGDHALCVVVDDAHEADLASLHALLFALRRLQQDRVLAIVVSRPEGAQSLPDGFRQLATITGQRIRLEGLAFADFQVMAKEVSRGSLSTRLARRLWEHTGGNPLHAWALLEEVPLDELDELDRADDPIPAPRSFARTVVRRLEGCSQGTRELMEAAAVLGRVSSVDAASRIVEIADPLVAVEEAIAAGLLEAGPRSMSMEVRFAHALIHSTVYHQLSVEDRARLHVAAASSSPSPDARMRHRIAAARGSDRELADDVAAFAAARYERREFAAAATYFLDSSRLSPDEPNRTARHWRSVDCWLDAGDVRQAGALAVTAAGGDDPWRNYALGRLALAAGQFDEARRRLRAVWDDQSSGEAVHADWRLRRSAATDLGHMCVVEGRAAEAISWGTRALRADPAVSSADRDVIGIVTAARGISGQTADALAGVAWIDEEGGIGPSSIDPVTARGAARFYSDDLEGARSDLHAVVEVSRAYGPYQRTVIAHGHLAELEYRSGRWDRALAHAQQALSLAVDTDQFWLLAFTHANNSYPLARRGEWERAQDHVDQALECARITRIPAACNYASTAAALLALSRGEPERAIEATDEISSWRDVDGVFEPGMLPWPELRAEALVRVGRLAEAESLLDHLLQVASARGRHSTQAAAHRVRGLLEDARGRTTPAGNEFAHALDHIQRVAMPFEQALIQLQYGAHLRRAGHRRHAASHLREAEQTLSGLAATPYVIVAQAELAACGLTPRARHQPERVKLTPQELAVGHLVADGLSNRELASRLFVSTKTVEFHLGNIYRKLGVRSRVQLANHLAGHRSDPIRV